MNSIINNYKNIHITFSEDSEQHKKFFAYLVNDIISKNMIWVNKYSDLDSIIQNHINPYDSIILNFNTNAGVNTHSIIEKSESSLLLKAKAYRYLYRNLNTNHIITRNTPHRTVIDDGVDDRMPQPREIAYACDLLVYVDVKKSIIKIIKNRYGDGEDSSLMIYMKRLIEICKRSEKIKSLYDSD